MTYDSLDLDNLRLKCEQSVCYEYQCNANLDFSTAHKRRQRILIAVNFITVDVGKKTLLKQVKQ